MLNKYDVIVVGAGHAGCEAAAAAANLGSNVLLITMDMAKIAHMSCNPAIGGIAKGQIVREIDALGGFAGIITDKTMVQFRMLNKSKGPAMWSPRAQSDRELFTYEWRKQLESISNLDFWQDQVVKLLIEKNKIIGVETLFGIKIYAKAVVLTNGTFLNGLIHIGKSNTVGGRIGEKSSIGISEQLREFGFETGRMKTGTPPRIDGRTIDFSKMIEQKGDENESRFSFLPNIKTPNTRRSCYITYTNPETHKILKTGFVDSPLFNGTIDGIGPRYCPSIEDKLVTFSGREKHQLFLEPEGLTTVEYYLNGFSSSLPADVQLEAMRKINGLENVKIFRPGYAIEYDYFDPLQLYHTLETKKISNLYFAGQINGTTGYEEAGAQGLIAGINAHRKIYKLDNFVLTRDQAYIGVLIDDLVTKGVNEPYRMFTSRAEYRILLRQDNADARLTELSYKLGLCSEYRYAIFIKKKNAINNIIDFIKKKSVSPKNVNPILDENNTSQIKQKTKLEKIILRPQININDIKKIAPEIDFFVSEISELKNEIIESAEIKLKYKGYIERERLIADKIKRLEHIEIYNDFDFDKINSLSIEARQKLSKIKPKNIGQASRIPGVSPSDINVLLVYFGR